MTGVAQLYQVDPPPKRLLGTAPWTVKGSWAIEPEDGLPGPRQASWGVGPAVGVLNGRWVAGATVAAPQLHFRALLRERKIEPHVSIVAGEGEWALLVGGLVFF